MQRRLVSHRQQGAHVDAYELMRLNSDEIGERTVYPQNMIGLIVRDNEVGDGIEDLDPMPVRLVHASEEPRILQGNRGMGCDGLQELHVLVLQSLSTIGQTQDTYQIARGTEQPDHGAVVPA